MALLEMSQAIFADLNLEKMTAALQHKCKELAGADRAAIFLLSDDGKVLIPAVEGTTTDSKGDRIEIAVPSRTRPTIGAENAPAGPLSLREALASSTAMFDLAIQSTLSEKNDEGESSEEEGSDGGASWDGASSEASHSKHKTRAACLAAGTWVRRGGSEVYLWGVRYSGVELVADVTARACILAHGIWLAQRRGTAHHRSCKKPSDRTKSHDRVGGPSLHAEMQHGQRHQSG